MPKHLFLISGNLGRNATFILESTGNTLRIQAKRKIRVNFKYFLSHVSLEYYYAGITKFSLLRISVCRLAKDFILFPKLVLTFLLFRYKIVIVTSQKEVTSPNLYYISGGQPSPLWVSRQSQIKGSQCWTSDHDLEWDMFRGQSRNGYLLDIQIRGKRDFINNENSQRNSMVFIRRTVTPQAGTLDIVNLKNVSVDRTQFHLKDGVAYPAHNFDYIEKISVPTPLISSTQEGDFSYTTPKSEAIDVRQIMSFPYSESWYHFVVEGLGALLSQESCSLNTPVLIRHTCPKNIRQVLKFLTGHDPIPINSNCSLNVQNLTLIQEWRYEKRFDFQSRSEDLHKIRNFLLQLSRSRMDSIHSQQMSQSYPSEVVFLTRPNRLYRRMENYNQAIQLLKKYGVTVIEPSSMNFLESCQIINDAKILIAETGAALTNLILCNSNVQILEVNPEGFEPTFWRGLSRVFSFQHQLFNAPIRKGSFKQKFSFPAEEISQYLSESR